MANAVMQSPDFSGFERFQPPFGLILYYCFTFVVMVSDESLDFPRPTYK
jgi:hypothetical protein